MKLGPASFWPIFAPALGRDALLRVLDRAPGQGETWPYRILADLRPSVGEGRASPVSCIGAPGQGETWPYLILADLRPSVWVGTRFARVLDRAHQAKVKLGPTAFWPIFARALGGEALRPRPASRIRQHLK